MMAWSVVTISKQSWILCIPVLSMSV